MARWERSKARPPFSDDQLQRRSLRSRQARTAPALTGVKPRVSRRAFHPRPRRRIGVRSGHHLKVAGTVAVPIRTVVDARRAAPRASGNASLGCGSRRSQAPPGARWSLKRPPGEPAAILARRSLPGEAQTRLSGDSRSSGPSRVAHSTFALRPLTALVRGSTASMDLYVDREARRAARLEPRPPRPPTLAARLAGDEPGSRGEAERRAGDEPATLDAGGHRPRPPSTG